MMRSTERFMMLLLITSLLAGCLPVKPVTAKAPAGNDLVIEIWASKDFVQPGETVHLRARATNLGAEPVIVDLKNVAVLDIWVKGQSAPLQRWSDGKPLTPDVTGLALQPGESKTIVMDWIPADTVSGRVYADVRYTSRYAWGDNAQWAGVGIQVRYSANY